MTWSDLLLRLRALLRYQSVESELDEELSFHLAMEARKNKAAGMSDLESQQRARVNFGGLEQVREECRDIRGLSVLENLARDLRYASRILRRAPLFSGVAIASLAIGIGANTAVFSLLDTVLFRMLPSVRNPEQLLVLQWGARQQPDITSTWSVSGNDGHGGWKTNVVSWAIFSGIRERSRTLSDVIGFSPLGPVNVLANGQALSTGAMVASGNYFQALGVSPIIGRAFTKDDETADGIPTAVVSYRFWERAFGRNPSAIGQTVYVNGQPCMVVGIAPKDFFGISAGGFMRTPYVDVTLPIRWRDRLIGNVGARMAWFGNDLFWVQMMGRSNGSIEPAIQSELAAIIANGLPESSRQKLGSEAPHVYVEPGSQGLDRLRRAYRQPLLILMAVVGLTLLMACANLVGLLLARATARQQEIMVRMAIGASRGRLVRQLLVEGALLSALGVAAGLGVAWWGTRLLIGLVASGSDPIAINVSPDLRVLCFTIAVSLLTTFLFALAPALRATRIDVASGLKENAATVPEARSTGASRTLLAVQVAVAVVLTAGAALFTRSLANVRSQPLGFNPRNIVLFNLAPGKNGYDETRGTQFYLRVLDRLKQSPGVAGASVSSERLISGFSAGSGILVEGSASQGRVNVNLNFVGPDFLDVMGMQVIMGREIASRDMSPQSRVAVINERVARQHFGDGSPIGRKFRWSNKPEWDVEVIGVVKDAKYYRLQGDAPATIYVPYTQNPYGWPQEMTVEVRTAGSAAAMLPQIRRAVSELDRMLPLTDVKTQEAQIDDSLAQERLFASLVSLFSGITLALACIGLYGAVAYLVTRRTREIGVRMALGAGRARVMRMLLSQIAITIVTGVVFGLAGTWALTVFVESHLYGIKPHDPFSLFLACAVVASIGLFAVVMPAFRAAKIDPMRALRYE